MVKPKHWRDPEMSDHRYFLCYAPEILGWRAFCCFT